MFRSRHDNAALCRDTPSNTEGGLEDFDKMFVVMQWLPSEPFGSSSQLIEAWFCPDIRQTVQPSEDGA